MDVALYGCAGCGVVVWESGGGFGILLWCELGYVGDDGFGGESSWERGDVFGLWLLWVWCCFAADGFAGYDWWNVWVPHVEVFDAVPVE